MTRTAGVPSFCYQLSLCMMVQASSDQDLTRLGSCQPAFRQGSLPPNISRAARHVAAAAVLPHFDSLPPSALAEDVLEASFARGLASAECFEVRPVLCFKFLGVTACKHGCQSVDAAFVRFALHTLTRIRIKLPHSKHAAQQLFSLWCAAVRPAEARPAAGGQRRARRTALDGRGGGERAAVCGVPGDAVHGAGPEPGRDRAIQGRPARRRSGAQDAAQVRPTLPTWPARLPCCSAVPAARHAVLACCDSAPQGYAGLFDLCCPALQQLMFEDSNAMHERLWHRHHCALDCCCR